MAADRYECVLQLTNGLEYTFETEGRPKLLSPNEAYILQGDSAIPFEKRTFMPWAIESLAFRKVEK